MIEISRIYYNDGIILKLFPNSVASNIARGITNTGRIKMTILQLNTKKCNANCIFAQNVMAKSVKHKSELHA